MKLSLKQSPIWIGLYLLISGTLFLRAENLPAPQTEGGKPLMQALKERKSSREFSRKKLSPQILSDLLWAAFGINRPDTDHRTAPSAMNAQEIDLYVATPDGVYLYEPKSHALILVLKEDIREKTGGQAYVKEASTALILVADYARMTKAREEDKDFYAAIDAGYISQNIYLYSASAGLATVVHELNRSSLAPRLKLRPDQRIIIAQSVGHPKEQ